MRLASFETFQERFFYDYYLTFLRKDTVCVENQPAENQIHITSFL